MKKIYLLSILGCILFWTGCTAQNSSNIINLEESNKTLELELDLEFENFEKEIGLEKIRTYEKLCDLISKSSDENFIQLRKNKVNTNAINEESVLKCANRAIKLSKSLNENFNLFDIKQISVIDKIDYKMDRNLILKLFEKLYFLGNFDQISLLDGDNDEFLTCYYIATTLNNAIYYNEDFSNEERLTFSSFLTSFEYLSYKISSVSTHDEATLDLLINSYDEKREQIKNILF